MRYRICRRELRMRATWLVVVYILVAASASSAQTRAQVSETPCANPKTMSHEESYMFGRLLSALEDLGGGYYGEARGKYEHIIRDMGKDKYSACFRWMAYDGLGQALVGSHKKKEAISRLTQAVEEAKLLTDKQREESEQHLDTAQRMK
jgi:hypothetical protein